MVKISRTNDELGVKNSTKKVVKINIEIDNKVLQYVNKLSELTNHTASSVITILLGIKILEEEWKWKKEKNTANSVKKEKRSSAR